MNRLPHRVLFTTEPSTILSVCPVLTLWTHETDAATKTKLAGDLKGTRWWIRHAARILHPKLSEDFSYYQLDYIRLDEDS
jgi:hypothetical protein